MWDESKQTFMGPNQCMEQEKKENERTKQEVRSKCCKDSAKILSKTVIIVPKVAVMSAL